MAKSETETGATETPLKLIHKLALIRRELNHVEKKGKNAHFGYSYMRAEDVAGDIGDRFAAANIVIGCADGKCEVHKMDKGFMVVIECTYQFVDGDSGESLAVWSCGAGYDSSDKGIYKARTGALKYALTQALCMRVGDDAEADDDSDKRKITPAKETKFISNGTGESAVLTGEDDRKRLLGKAKQLMGDKEGRAWVKTRTTDLGIKGPENFHLHQFMMLMGELEQLEAGEHVEPIEDSDIPF